MIDLSPYPRIIILILGIVGTILCDNVFFLLIFWVLYIIPIVTKMGVIKTHSTLLLVVAFPMFLMLGVLNLFLLNNGVESLNGIFITILKIIIYTSLFQIAFIIAPENLLSTFKKWKLKGDTLIIVLGAYTVWTEVVENSLKIVTARYAKGYVKKRTIINNICQIPALLVPLIIGILKTSQIRSDSWNEKQIFSRLESIDIEEEKTNLFFNTIATSFVCIWFVINLYNRVI